MGKLATIIARLMATIVLLFPHVTVADDAGPGREIRPLRHDAAILLADRVHHDPTLAIDRAVVDGDRAIVAWHAGNTRGIDGFQRRYGIWWDLLRSYPSDDTGSVCLRSSAPLAPTGGPVRALMPPDFDAHACAQEPLVLVTLPGSVLHGLTYDVTARMPTSAENWLNYPRGNSYAFFDLSFDNEERRTFDAGLSMDVWLPFVPDPENRYSVSIGHAERPMETVDGTVRDSTLHFELPAFAIGPHAMLMCEIEGDPVSATH